MPEPRRRRNDHVLQRGDALSKCRGYREEQVDHGKDALSIACDKNGPNVWGTDNHGQSSSLGAFVWLEFSLLREEHIEQLAELRYVSLGSLGKGCHGVSLLSANE